jgi:[ribosomal protein S18]-alanine N-acetyltransferase
MVIREYNKGDNEQLISLLRLNTPVYFASSEVQDYVFFLDNFIQNYFVAEMYSIILGAGGFNFKAGNPEVAHISWDFVHPDYHGKGIGSRLLNHRLEVIRAIPGVEVISVRTSQLAFQFYLKAGFVTKETIPGFWAKGLDLVKMELKL